MKEDKVMKMNDEMKVFLGTVVTAVVMLIALMIISPCCFGAEIEPEEMTGTWDTDYTRADFLRRNGFDPLEVEFVTPNTVTTEMLVTRTPDTLIVEETIGVVLGYREPGKPTGKVLNTTDEFYNYICYEDYAVPFEYGDIVVTYFVYDRYGNGEDDYDRCDEYVIDTNQLIEEIG